MTRICRATLICAATLCLFTICQARTQATPGHITKHNVVYAMIDGTALLMDVDIPTNQGTGTFPLIVSIHGGGWYSGGRGGAPATKEALRGYVVARIEYRLSNSFKFPLAIYDCKVAVRYLRHNA